MRRFVGIRPSPTKQFIDNGWTNGPTEPDYEGVVFSDGTVSVRWITKYRSTSHWDSMEVFMKVYGSPDTDTLIEWID